MSTNPQAGQIQPGDILKLKVSDPHNTAAQKSLRVLFIKYSKRFIHEFHGVVTVAGGSTYPIGEYSKRWQIDCFELAHRAQSPDKAQEVDVPVITSRLFDAISQVLDNFFGGEINADVHGDMCELRTALNLATGKDAESEVPELPIAWCVMRDKENYQIINRWASAKKPGVEFYKDSGYVNSDGSAYDFIKPGYTLISYSQFLRDVPNNP